MPFSLRAVALIRGTPTPPLFLLLWLLGAQLSWRAARRLNKVFLAFTGSLHQASSLLGFFHMTLSGSCLPTFCLLQSVHLFQAEVAP